MVNIKALFIVRASKNKFLGIWKAQTRNNRGNLIILHGKTKTGAIKLATAERNQQNRLIERRKRKGE